MLLPAATIASPSRPAPFTACRAPVRLNPSPGSTRPCSPSPYLVSQADTSSMVSEAFRFAVSMVSISIRGAYSFSSVTGAQVRAKKGELPGMWRTTA